MSYRFAPGEVLRMLTTDVSPWRTEDGNTYLLLSRTPDGYVDALCMCGRPHVDRRTVEWFAAHRWRILNA